ncbi:hypothetical protein B0H12DRAFT_785600 [Mycena haematopus]|nr:hypothetical protein B0H12DRAFT_785600 [Mycena haematopus]
MMHGTVDDVPPTHLARLSRRLQTPPPSRHRCVDNTEPPQYHYQRPSRCRLHPNSPHPTPSYPQNSIVASLRYMPPLSTALSTPLCRLPPSHCLRGGPVLLFDFDPLASGRSTAASSTSARVCLEGTPADRTLAQRCTQDATMVIHDAFSNIERRRAPRELAVCNRPKPPAPSTNPPISWRRLANNLDDVSVATRCPRLVA